jgi:hypothetical protein
MINDISFLLYFLLSFLFNSQVSFGHLKYWLIPPGTLLPHLRCRILPASYKITLDWIRDATELV